jgi:hypothetical protein
VRWTLLATAIVGLLLLVQDGRGSERRASTRLELVDGSLSLRNSLEGQAVFTADDIGPGDSTSGTVTVANAGTLAGDLTLTESALSDTPGPGGQPLSAQLRLVVRDVTAGVSPATVYAGPLNGVGALPLGTLGPGAARVFDFTASLPATEDNSVAGASMSVSYTWTAEEARPPVDPPVEPPPPPEPPPPDSTDALKAPLRLRVRIPSAQPLMSRGKLIAYVRCDQTCWLRGHARLAVPRGRALPTRRVQTGRVRPGREQRLLLAWPSQALKTANRALGTSRHGSVRVTVSGRAATGEWRTVEKRARIKRR